MGENFLSLPRIFRIPINLNLGYEDKEGKVMCMFCKCDTVTSSFTTHVVNYNGTIIVIKNVPCEECVQCGEKFYTDDIAEKIEKLVNLAKQMMQEIAVLDYSEIA